MAQTTTRTAAPAAVEVPRVPLVRSTLARHLTLAVIVFVAVVALSFALDPFRNLQLTNVAYFACAAAGLSVLTGLSADEMREIGADAAIETFHDRALWDNLERRIAA